MQRKAFLLRIDPAVLEAVQHWADDDLRSLNAQIEFLLRRALTDRGRMKERSSASTSASTSTSSPARPNGSAAPRAGDAPG
jgi:hypothetical protein